MKTFTLFPIIFILINLFLFQSIYAQPENLRIDQEDYYQKDPASPNSAPVLVYVSRNEFHYDNGGTKYTSLESFSRPIGTTEWLQASQIINTYNENNNLLTSEIQSFDGMNYIPTLLSEYSYNVDDKVEIVEHKAYIANEWMNNSRDVYSYYPDLSIESLRGDIWDSFTNTYLYNSLIVYTYNNGLLTNVDSFTYSGLTPVDNYRGTFTYDVNDQIDYFLYEKHNGSGWENWQYADYNYFDIYLISAEQQIWNTDLNIWENQIRTEYTYGDFDEIPIEIHGKGWDKDEANGGANPFWYDSYKLVYQISSILNIEKQIFDKSLAYPNPFKSQITISLSKALESQGTLILLDSTGKEISNTELKSGTKTISLNNGHLATGIYFIKISNADYHQTIKIVKE